MENSFELSDLWPLASWLTWHYRVRRSWVKVQSYRRKTSAQQLLNNGACRWMAEHGCKADLNWKM